MNKIILFLLFCLVFSSYVEAEVYIAKKGSTLNGISDLGVSSVNQIIELNSLKSNKINVGQPIMYVSAEDIEYALAYYRGQLKETKRNSAEYAIITQNIENLKNRNIRYHGRFQEGGIHASSVNIAADSWRFFKK